MRMSRFGKSGTCALLLVAAVALTGCELTATGTGAVTITFDEPATAFNGTSPYGVAPGKTGDILAFCAAGVVCLPDTPGLIQYWYKPAAGDTQGVVTVGSLVLDPDGNTVPLPAGSYRAEGIRFLDILGPTFLHTGTTDFIVGGSSPDMSTSMQSTVRASADATCSTGWIPSWATWPNNGKGGYVCDRWIYIYYPDLPVPTQKQASQVQPWRQEIGRSSSQASCPAGYDPAWSQWPNNNTGGHVCARDVVS
jgi:hypothetical protein